MTLSRLEEGVQKKRFVKNCASVQMYQYANVQVHVDVTVLIDKRSLFRAKHEVLTSQLL